MIKRSDFLIFLTAFVVCLYLAFNLNFPGGKRSFPSEIYTDKAGYYVYLPAVFIYNFNARKFPYRLQQECGSFTLDTVKNKIITKYTYGVALMMAPVFLPAHWMAKILHYEADGFSLYYQKMLMIPAILYLILGLFFLKKFLDHYYRRKVVYLTLMFLFLGTNLYFFSIDEGSLSHIYSFFLFSLFIFLLKRYFERGMHGFGHFIGICIALSLAVLIRPTNILLVLFFFLLDVRSMKDILKRVRHFLHPRFILTFVVILFLCYLPQMIYWKYLTGDFLYYSYKGESFIFWNNPRLIQIWFSPLNGLFLHSPMVFLLIAGMVVLIFRKNPNGFFLLIFFLLISYIFSSWWCWYYGGSFGSRPFVEFYAVLALSLAAFIDYLFQQRNLFIRTSGLTLMVLFSWYNLHLSYHYMPYTGTTWGWEKFLTELEFAGLDTYRKSDNILVWDFDNVIYGSEVPITLSESHSPPFSFQYDRFTGPVVLFYGKMEDLLDHKLTEVKVKAMVKPAFWMKTGMLFVTEIIDAGQKTVFRKDISIDRFMRDPGKFNEMDTVIFIPPDVGSWNAIRFSVQNPLRRKAYIDDVVLEFK